MMLSMWKVYQYDVVYVDQYDIVYVERLPLSCCICGKDTSMMLSMWKGYQYDVVYLEMLPV